MKRFLKTTAVITAIALSLAFVSACANGSNKYDNGEMRTQMTSMEYAKDMKLAISLGNTLDANGDWINGKTVFDYEKAWGAMETTWEIIDGMKTAGFDTVRVPVYWGNTMVDDGEFIISEEMFNRVGEIIDYCRKSGLYTVINIHHYDEYLIKKYEKDEVLRITEKLWTQIAERYKKYSDYLVFEGFNEALGTVREGDNFTEDEKFTYVNQMNQTFVDTVRATGGNNENRLLVISGYHTNIDHTSDERFIIPADSAENKIMVSVHYVDNAIYWAKSNGNEKWLEYCIAQCELLKKAFTDKGVPVFLGEIASTYDDEHMADDAIYKTSSECLGIMLQMLIDYGFVPVIWDTPNNFYSRPECRIVSESNKALIEKFANKLR